MDSINDIYLKAIEFFPRWMNIRRRPYKSSEGDLLSSIIEEYQDVRRAIEEYQKDFFLVNFFGREDEILETLYAAHIGAIEDFSEFKINDTLTVTTDIETFQQDTKTYYYQDGYLLVRPRFVKDDRPYLDYTYKGYPYSIRWIEMHVWNVYDEFAWFAGLSRFEKESNKELCTRTLAAFKNRTNVTEKGLRNAIVNIASDILSKATITFEQPTEKNMALPDDAFGTVFERLAQENKDLARTKIWDLTYWENRFKTMSYLPHIWDAEVRLYQDGVGYRDSLAVTLSNNLTDIGSTDVSVTAYRKSKRAIEQYIQKNMIQKELTLSLKRYKDILATTKLQYKIVASNVKRLEPSGISFFGYRTSTRTEKQYLSDIALSLDNITEVPNNKLEADTKYQLIFYPNGPIDKTGNHYGTMEIPKCDQIYDGTTTSLLKPYGSFKVYNGVFQHSDIKFYTDTIKNLTSYENVKDTDSGMTVSDITRPGRFMIDVTDARNQYIIAPLTCRKIDYTTNRRYVFVTKHFSYRDDIIEDLYNDTDSTITITMKSVKDFSFNLLEESDPVKQGTVRIDVTEPNKSYTKNMLEAGTFSLTYDIPTDIKVIITKTGMNPIRIGNILAARVGFSVTALDDKDNDIPVVRTPFGTLVPNNAKELVIELQAYDNSFPYIDYIHIGPSLNNGSVYTVDIDSSNGDTLSVDTNCRMSLVNLTTGKITNDYVTKSTYRNDTNDTGIIYIDTSKYTQIDYSSSKIYADANTGDNYIVVTPGTEISYIKIKGTAKKLSSVKTLADVLTEQKITGYECYVNQNISDIILYNKSDERLFTLRKSYLDPNCDAYHIAMSDPEITSVFIQDSTHTKIGTDTTAPFSAIAFYPTEYQEYVAYNTKVLYQTDTTGVPIVYNFSPLLASTTFVLFQIVSVESADIKFIKEHGEDTWSLGRKAQGIHIRIHLDTENQKSYQAEIKKLQATFIIANSIPLRDVYEIDGIDTELAKYIIEPPAKMKVEYKNAAAVDNVRVESDGFTKLLYSNIDDILDVSIDGRSLTPNEYSLLSEAGIVVWNNPDLHGKVASVTYRYAKPYALSFISLNDLYDIAGYTVDAYEAINVDPDVYTYKKDGDTFSVSYPEADHLTAVCENNGFMAVPSKDNASISVYKISDKNVVVAHNGYLYDQGKEYWMFADRYETNPDRYDGLTMYNVRKIPGKLLFDIESTNHLLNSSMTTSYLDTLCVVDFMTNKHIPEISKLRSLTPCDSFNGWHGFFMDVSLKESGVSYDLVLTPKESFGYAALELTDYIKEGDTIDLDISDHATVYFCRDILLDDQRVRKVVYAEPTDVFIDKKYVVKDYDPKGRYFLLVTGEPNDPITLSEIVIANDPIDDVHRKNIDKFGYMLPEKRNPGTNVPLKFTSSFARENQIEFDRNNEFMLGMTADYGLTLLSDVDFDACQINRITYLKDVFQTTDESGTIVTPALELDNFQALRTLNIRINNILFDDVYRNFDIAVLTSDTYNGTYTTVFTKEDANEAVISKRYLKRFVRFQITMPADTIIDSIAIFAGYNEDEAAPHVRYHTKGTLVTKLFDTCAIADYKLISIEASRVRRKETMSFEIRGCREDNRALQWTDWYPITTDDNFNVTSENIFRGYRLFQLRVTVESKDSRILLDGITMKVV